MLLNLLKRRLLKQPYIFSVCYNEKKNDVQKLKRKKSKKKWRRENIGFKQEQFHRNTCLQKFKRLPLNYILHVQKKSRCRLMYLTK